MIEGAEEEREKSGGKIGDKPRFYGSKHCIFACHACMLTGMTKV
jgi:hypothetical protein